MCRPHRAACMCLALVLLPGPALFAQAPAKNPDLLLVGTISGFKHDSRVHDSDDAQSDWQPGGSARMRLYFRDYFHGDFDLALARTRRNGGIVCTPAGGCREPQVVNGTVWVVAGGFGLNAKKGEWRPYGGVGFGWTFDSQPGSEIAFGGPTLTLYAGLERQVTRQFSAILEYRQHRQYWKNQWSSLNDIYLTNHQIDVGFGFRPGKDDRAPGQ